MLVTLNSLILLATGGTCAEDLGVLAVPQAQEPALPPSIVLKTSPTLPETVSVTQGQQYVACGRGVLSSESKPCELGADAMDARGRDVSMQARGC
jgi:hypothetical protein